MGIYDIDNPITNAVCELSGGLPHLPMGLGQNVNVDPKYNQTQTNVVGLHVFGAYVPEFLPMARCGIVERYCVGKIAKPSPYANLYDTHDRGVFHFPVTNNNGSTDGFVKNVF